MLLNIFHFVCPYNTNSAIAGKLSQNKVTGYPLPLVLHITINIAMAFFLVNCTLYGAGDII